ncbi:DNA helicase RecG (plasmid) [Leptolyngbya sp. BL0902]|uniref:ATP-dependent DNA helicase RecG n=1 Tax=Leptolyngbya sp. BL0902 TaxID=1115757 RepID=UPI0018E8E307|nr:ATP-dependent DNA helicase RecG [Leptolyngbya sp. BL0902]QQE67424.1 DNA helicase RecG [Leptolyngbya sp. BL0902]
MTSTQTQRKTPTPDAALAKLGLTTDLDLLHHYPKQHQVIHRRKLADLQPGETVITMGRVVRHSIKDAKGGQLIVQTWVIRDKTGRHRLVCTQFHKARLPYTSAQWRQQQGQTYAQGQLVTVTGPVHHDSYVGGLTIKGDVVPIRPKSISTIPKRVLNPVYRLSKGLDMQTLQGRIREALQRTPLHDPIPAKFRQRHHLMELSEALAHIHFPPDDGQLEAARRRLVFDEFFYLQMALLLRRGQVPQRVKPQNLSRSLVERFKANLPFALTGAQRCTLSQILDDLTQTFPMNRLVQGDVGSGKTVVAVAACLAVIEQGHQAALMVPTETLAQQHYAKVKAWLEPLGLKTALLTGHTSTKERRILLSELWLGRIHLMVGTHALSSTAVQYADLGLVVIDEQHRFGVKQRNALLKKGPNPHLLSLTATPIPRTLALAMHQDMDVSLIDELPPGRLPIVTQVLTQDQSHQIHRLLDSQLAQGFQAYVVLPLVKDTDNSEMRSVETALDTYQRAFPEYQVGMLHGQMSSAAQTEALEAFRTGQTDILIATSVIEVGVDVPNATVMVVEQAERFGLAQLHQLRGRVGRSDHPSYCILVDGAETAASAERLQVLVQHQDGFTIAEADLKLRGAGDVLGHKQAGVPKFALADLMRDQALLKLAHTAARSAVNQGARLKGWNRMVTEAQRREHLEKALRHTHLN